MSFERKELSSGVFFNAVHETKFKANLISMRLIVPLSEETAAKNALIFPVLLRGCEKYPDLRAIGREKESIYNTDISESVYKRGDTQILELRMNLLDNRYAIDGMDITAKALSLFEELLLHPVTENGVFRSAYVESEKAMLINDIRARINNKGRYASQRVVEEMFEDDPFGVSELGTVETVSAVCPICLYRQYKRILSHARIEIFAIGNFDFDALEARFASLLKPIVRGDIMPTETKPMRPARAEVKTIYEHQNVTQGKLVLGFYTGHTVGSGDYHIFQVANAIFGGSPTSKLFMNVRERLSLCYYCSSSENGQKGYLTVSSGIEFDKEKKAVDEILSQLDKLKKGEITDDELSDSKLMLINSLGSVGDSTGALLNWHFACLMNGELLSPAEKADRIRSVTKDDVVKAAGDITLDTYYFLCGKEDKQ